jgi:DNA uptake protein ComE-like DNA-binding protein
MSMRPDHKALLFLAIIAGLGAAVRAARAISATPSQQLALERQMQAADSARRAAAKRSDNSSKPSASRGRAARTATIAGQRVASNAGGAPHRDYRGRLDLDVASAAEIDSLPAVGPSLAKRIAADRMTNGAFRELAALRRVKGVTPKLLVQLDSLVSFSGVYKPPQPSDTLLAVKPRRKR